MYSSTYAENLRTSVAFLAEGVVIAVAAVDLLVFRAKRLVNKAHLAERAEEAGLMPMALLVGQVPPLDADWARAVAANVGKVLFVTAQTHRVSFAQHVALTRQRLDALGAAEMRGVPVAIHGARILAGEDELVARTAARLDLLGEVTLAEQLGACWKTVIRSRRGQQANLCAR